MTGDCKKPNGICTAGVGTDGLSVQCVAGHSLEKHDYVRRYLTASSGPRSKFLVPGPDRPAGGAAFIDLFAGPGMVRVRGTGAVEAGSPLLALQEQRAPFTRVLLSDSDDETFNALERRVTSYHKAGRDVRLFKGDCNVRIDDIAKEIPPYGLNVALIDPFSLNALRFATIARLATFSRMDLIIHFPIGDIRRNWGKNDDAITAALGTDEWKQTVKSLEDVPLLKHVLRRQLVKLFGCAERLVKDMPVDNIKGVPVYHLMYASKSEKGTDIWNSITRIDARGQRDLL